MSGKQGCLVFASFIAGMLLLFGLFVVFLVSLEDDREDWEDRNTQPSEIYEGPERYAVHSPFQLLRDPMERLLLVNVEEDPDRVYLGFEPQRFDDPVHGRGLLVIGWRVDGRVDVYHQPSLTLDPATFRIAGQGLAHMVMRPLEGARFDITRRGVELEAAFEDLEGRRVELHIRETSPRTRRPFHLLAPMGSTAASPGALPLIFLHDFYFVRRAGTTIRVAIDGREHRPDRLPLPVDGSRMYFTRYAERPFILRLNPDHDGPVEPLDRSRGWDPERDRTWYHVHENRGRWEIAGLGLPSEWGRAEMGFHPPFPQLAALKDGADVTGDWDLWTEPWAGRVGGGYRVRRSGDVVRVELDVKEGWDPPAARPSIFLMYRASPVFRTWPASYRWEAEVRLDGEGPAHMISRWVRVE